MNDDVTQPGTWCGYYDREEDIFDPAESVVGTWDEARAAVRSYLTQILIDLEGICPACTQAGTDGIAQLDALTPGSGFTTEVDGWAFVLTPDVQTIGEKVRR